VIVLDNGSSTQDVDAIFLGKQHGFDFIVCDHHVFGERDAITELTAAHINQLRFGPFETCTGFLSFELARMISPHFEEFHDVPATAGISDRCKDEVMEHHFKKAKSPKELLVQFEQVLTWLLGSTPPCDNSDFLQALFWSTPEYKKSIVQQYLPMLQSQCKSALDVLELTKDIRQVGDVQVAFLQVSHLPRRTYPKVGMATGLFFDKAKQINPKTVTVGVMDDGLVLRITPESGTDVHKVIAYLNDKLPYPVLGGGHAVAGSAKLSKVVTDPKELEEIKQLLLQHVKEMNKV
jgi:RecJ-like exonuclease